ncbi:MAG TPA: hypothetical protein VGF30_07080, partial [Bacteroidia bacterium]
SIYQLEAQESLYVAVSKEFTEIISIAISEYGNIKNVPAYKTVKGILLSHIDNHLYLDENAKESDVVINSLRVK